LQHIAEHCPQLAGTALKRAFDLYRNTSRDTVGYLSTVTQYRSLDPAQQPGPISIDHTWVEATDLKNSKEKNKLEAELKTYTSNMIKESIRVSAE
jgi:COP9 signalosome complex subunit 1